MNEPMETPPTEAPANKNRTLFIVIAIIAVLCCCCAIIAALGWQFGDQILFELGLY